MESETTVALVALVISVIALLGTILQVLQQYFASATGFTNCDKKVLGLWSEGALRKFRMQELRFEVQFDTPVIFVTPASNKTKGPITDQPIVFVDGTQLSLDATKTEPVNADQSKLVGQNGKAPTNGHLDPDGGLRRRATFQTVRATHKEKEKQLERIHTADNERATWVTLLSHLHNMESSSEEWQQDQIRASGPPQGSNAIPVPKFEDRTLAIAIQVKRKSWDTMPSSVTKPYATTTMCHIVEIAAMMGLHWKVFDRFKDLYRAEGNGYMLSGHDVADLGIMFTFQVSGKSKFHASRIIPVDEVKELAFGFVSTLFRKHNDKDNRRLEFPTEEPRDLGVLQLGSSNDMAETLVSFGCNTNSANCLRDNSKKHGHLFPVAFEITGMLGRRLHVRNTFFRMLPNPTFYHWDKKFFSLRRLLTAYTSTMDDDLLRHPDQLTPHLNALKETAETVVKAISNSRRDKGEDGFDLKLLCALDDAIDFCDTYLTNCRPGPKNNQKFVEVVLREHFQLVLYMVNANEKPTVADEQHSVAMSTREELSFQDLNAASPELKQEKFMDIYFNKVLPTVVLRCKRTLTMQLQRPTFSTAHQAGDAPPPPPQQHQQQAPRLARTPTPTPGLPLAQAEAGNGTPSSGASSEATAGAGTGTLLDAEITEVWCTLVFRMLCWLLLHDFHKNDVQVAKSEQWGSRLPVYIA